MAVMLHHNPQTPPLGATATHTHNKAACRANDRRALTQLLATLKGCSLLKERWSLNQFTKNLTSGASKPSTDTHNGVKDTWQL